MKTYKTIEWPTAIPTEQILNVIKLPDPDNEFGYVGKLDESTELEILKLLNIDVSKCGSYTILLVYFLTDKMVNIHSDIYPDLPLDKQSRKALFFPLTSCDDLVWKWYKAIDRSKIFYYGHPGRFPAVPMITADNAECIDATTGHSALMVDIRTWHNLRNTGSKPAIGISVRLGPWGYNIFDSTDELPDVFN